MALNLTFSIEEIEVQLESLIRSGKISEALNLLNGVKPAEIPRERLIQFADFGRRVQQPLYTLKVLGKVIKAHREKITLAQPLEIIAYVGALIKLGFYDESHRWLDQVLKNEFPQVYDMKARIQIAQWNYRSSAFYLKRFVPHLEKESYAWQVAILNLSASFISSGRADEALPWLRRLRKVARLQGHQLILGNAWELQAQAEMELGNVDKARRCLQKSMKVLGRNNNIWAFYVRKWEFMIRLKEEEIEVKDLQLEFKELRHEALKNNYYEDVRELDRSMAVKNHDFALLKNIYFGSFSKEYRKRLLNIWPTKLEMPKEYLFPVIVDKDNSLPVFQVEKYLKPNQLPYQLFHTLTHDLYRPVSMGHIFSRIYPGEYFDPFHSKQRLSSLVQVLRSQLKGSTVGVRWSSFGLQLTFKKSLLLPLSETFKPFRSEGGTVVEIRQAFGKRWFNRSQLESSLNISESKALRLLHQASEAYKMEVSGAGRSRRYRFK